MAAANADSTRVTADE
ncbi:hypothetical protein NNC06_04160 [Escherichia fergusonii]|nr:MULTISPECIES: hypothetical protein [Escherichia]MCP9695136.1 hypothetical protein [Escherichia fergusonii]